MKARPSDCSFERIDKISDVDELVTIRPIAQNPDFPGLIDELVQDGKEAEPAAAHDRGTTKHSDMHLVLISGQDFLTFPLRDAIDLEWVNRSLLTNWL